MAQLTSRELVDQVRQQIDEFNNDSLTDQHVLNVINRAVSNAANIFVRRAEGLMLAYYEFNTTAGTSEYDFPPDIYGKCVTEVQVFFNNRYVNLQRLNVKESTNYSTNIKVLYPSHYIIMNNKLKLYPFPNRSNPIRVWYSKAFDQMVLPQGRIVGPLSSSNNYFYIDSVGSDLSTSGDNSYINVVSFETGEIKSTVKINSIATANNKITLATTQGSNRTKYFNRTVEYSSTLDADIEIDDLICIAKGTCVTQIPDMFENYLIMSSALDIRRRFGEPTQEEFAALKGAEEDLLKAWAGQENSARINRRSLRYR